MNANIITDFCRGEDYAFEIVFKKYYKGLFHFCNQYIQNYQESEDTCLIVFQSLFQKCNSFDSDVSIKSYLFTSARSRCITFLKTKALHSKKELETIALDVDTQLADKYSNDNTLHEILDYIISRMPAECAKVFKLLIFDGMKPKEIAALLNITTSTVYNHKLNAMKHIEKYKNILNGNNA